MRLVKQTIGECLELQAKDFPNQAALEYQDKIYTWKEVNESSDYCAVAMCELGIKKGDHVGIWSVNNPGWVVTFLALCKIGAIPVLINTCYKETELSAIIQYADMKYLYYGLAYKETRYEPLVERLRQLPDCKIEEWIPLNCDVDFSGSGISKKDLDQLTETKKKVRYQDITCMMFTSGTTGRPKGVLLSHYNLINSARATAYEMNWNREDKLLLAVPLFHCFGITSGLLASICIGHTTRIIEYFKTKQVLEQIETYQCTILNGVPSMFLALIRNSAFTSEKLVSLRSGIVAGAPIRQSEYWEIHEALPQMALIQSYGQTEASPCVTFVDAKASLVKRSQTVGRIIPKVEVRIWDETRGDVTHEQKTGEIQVRGFNVMLGYYALEQETHETISKEGWLKTGDLGYLDLDGYLVIVGRKKEIIIRAGENIAPIEIETLILDIPTVQEVKVVGIRKEVIQEEVVACIIAKKGAIVSEREIRQYLEPRIAHYKVPSHIVIFEKFPLTASGKIKVSELREQATKKIKEEQGEVGL